MNSHVAEEAFMPISNKLIALSQLFDSETTISKQDLDEAGFVGVAEILRSIDREISTICGDLDEMLRKGLKKG